MALTPLMEKFKPALRAARKVDVRKPTHAIVVGVMVGGLVAPILGWMAEQQRYQLSKAADKVIAQASPKLAHRLVRDDEKRAFVFNRDGVEKGPDKLQLQTGGGGKNAAPVYTATMPEKLQTGIKVTDNVNDMSVTMRPLFGALDGRIVDGRVVYPLKGDPGQLILTPKGNGIKEDIYLEQAIGDRLQYEYELDYPDTLVAKITPDGGLGFYSGDPALFGNITYGSEVDREKVEQARKNAQKTYLMFKIPAPEIKQSSPEVGGVKARFELDGKMLKVISKGLAKASYPLSIDPTFTITSASEFKLGALEDNIDLSVADQIGRGTITGGALSSWDVAITGNPNLPTTGGPTSTGCSNGGTDYNFGLTAYNGFLYLMGGGDGGRNYTCYTPINSDGTLGGWVAAANAFNTGRTGACVVGWNGYLYVMGGETANGGTQYQTVEYSKIQADGSPGTWATTSAMITGRTYGGCVAYKGVIYAGGGARNKNNGQLTNLMEHASIRADGTLSTWTATTAMPTTMNRFGMVAYNGFVYVMGGYTGSTIATVSYVPINSDGTLGTWASTASLSVVRRSMGYGVERGYLYVFGGCSTNPACTTPLASSEYAPIHADGTVGAWTTSTSVNTARMFNGGATYNGYVYSIGGCSAEPTNNNNCGGTEYGDSQYAAITLTPGDVNTPAGTSALGSGLGGNAVTAYNGYLYNIGGCQGATCSTYSQSVQRATINDDGGLGAWTVTGVTILPTGRYGAAAVAYNGKLYVCGGNAGGTHSSNCISSTLNATDGSNGSWSTETNNFSTQGARRGLVAAIWDNVLYLVGGTDGTTYYAEVLKSTIGSSGALGTFSTTSQGFSTGRVGHGAAIYNGNLYVVGGQNSSGTLLSDVQRGAIVTGGDITSAFSTDASLPAARTYHSVSAHNSVLYVLGGMTSTTATNNILWATMSGTNGAISSWNTSSKTLATSRQNAGSAAYKGYLYIAAGCTSGQVCSTYTNTVEVMRPQNGGTGQLGSYTSGTFTTARADMQYAVMSGYIYIIGGCTAYTSGVCTAMTTSVQSIKINPGGSLGVGGVWTANTALSSGRSYGGAVAYNDRLYVVGGSISGTAEDRTVLTATANSSGTLTWADNAANYLPTGEGRNGFALVTSNGFIYAIGGSNGGLTTEVLYSRLGSDGNLSDPNGCGISGSAWCTTTAINTARKDLNAQPYNGVVYVVGGYNGANLSDTQYAVVDTATGALGTWKYTTREDRGQRARQVVSGNGYMYFLGHETTGTNVSYAAINLNNTLGNLYKTTAMPAVHTNGGAVFYNGFIYAFGGCTTFSSGNCTAMSNAVHSAGQQGQARVAHYSKLFDTQVDTAPSAFQVNGSGSFVAQLQTSSTSDPVLGVAQLIDPALPGAQNLIFALDSTGANVGLAFNYFVFLALDDSQTGTFPDVGSYAEEFSIFYHANPTRRLRHGASFTNTGCNAVAANGCILDTAP